MTPTETLLRYLLETSPAHAVREIGSIDALRTEVTRLDLGGAFYAVGRRRGDLDALPEALTVDLRRQHARNTTQALRLQHEIGELRAHLEPPFVPLKGAALLSHDVLPDPGQRTMLDLDLLTRRADRDRVVAGLESLGFRMDAFGGPPKHLPAFRRGPTMLEVHEVAFWSPSGRRFGLEDFTAAAEPLAPTLVHLVHHALVSSVIEPSLVCKTLLDVARLLAVSSNPPALLERASAIARAANLASSLDAFAAAARALSSGAPLDGGARDIAALCEPTTPAEASWRYASFYLRALTGPPAWYRRETLASLLLPPRAAIEDAYGLRPGSPWAYPAYALRPVHLAVRGIQAFASRRKGRA